MVIKRVPEPQAASKGRSWFVLFMVVAAVLILIGKVGESTKSINKSSAPQQYATIDKSSAMQAKREKLISNMLNTGIFSRVDLDGIAARVTVGPNFYRMDYDMKQSMVSVVYAQKFDGTGIADFVRVIDNMTGKEIGMYSAADGGLKMY